MRRFVLIISVFLMALFPLCGAYAEEQVYIENPDFQYMDAESMPSGWYTDAWYTGDGDFFVEMDEVDGITCLHITNPAQNDVRLCQDIDVEPDSYYRISCDIKARGVSDGGGANVSVAGTMAASEPITGNADWRRAELVGRTEQDQYTMTVCMRLGGYSSLSSGEAWFKDFSVTKLDGAPAGEVQDFYYYNNANANSESGSHNVNELHGGAMLLTVLLSGVIGAICYRKGILKKPGPDGEGVNVCMLLVLAFLMRCLLSLVFYGHSTDINCFMAWSYHLAGDGLANFYNSGMFADYPPGYMYILWLTGSIARALGLEYGGAGYVLITKMPSIMADIFAAYMTYRIARKRLTESQSALLCCIVAFNPAMAFISGAWGQVDMIPAIMLLGVIYLFDSDKLELAGLLYGAAIITKPQSLMIGPLLAVAYFAKVYDKGWRYALRTLAAVALAVIAIFALAWPFKGAQQPLWFMDKLLGTATSYPYASVEAFNMPALLGGNWADVNAPLLGLTYGKWGSIMIALSCIAAAAGYIRSRDKKYSLTLSGALLLSGIFTFGQYMHERYIFPVLPLLIAAFLLSGDRRLIKTYMIYTCGLLLNVLAAFVVVKSAALRGAEYNVITLIGSVINLMAFASMITAYWSMTVRREIYPAYCEERMEKTDGTVYEIQGDTPVVTLRDRLYCFALTLVYAIIALTNLGTTQAPENYWIGSVGDTAAITLESPEEISEIRIFGGIYEGRATLSFSDGQSIEYVQENDDMFRWITVSGDDAVYTDKIGIEVTEGRVWINEMALLDGDGNIIKSTASEGAEALVDEPEEIPETPSYLNGMYFDELYHGRTAYEHLHGIAPYENSHPPLGKIFIMLGIAIFGMNAFGWRIIGTLFGIAMVPIMYAFGKKLFRRSDYALLAAGLFTFDFMHFTQTRIATIDVYGVFFIILMYYFMYDYYCMNFFDDGLKATLKPLAIAGLFFGLGAASKWICIYAGGGLAVILFTSLGQRYAEYRRFKNAPGKAERRRVQGFWRNTLMTLLWCCVFYIAVPVVIYLLSYIPYVLCENHYGLSGIWDFQKFMFNYHSGLTATHPYESPWWQWPLDLRPVWYYISYRVPEGMTSTISAFGNPAVWWVCSACTGILCARLIAGRSKPDKGIFVLLIGLGANYLPWVLVTRCTFAYHFFASVPFIVFITVWLIREFDERHPKLRRVKWAYLGLVVLLFALFYPVISGAPASIEYVRALEWLPGWTFMGY